MLAIWAGLATFAVTTVVTLSGVGAAFVLIPMYLAMGIEIHLAMSTALFLNGLSMVFASINFAREKLILWKLAFPILIVAMLLSPVGAYVSNFLPRSTLLFCFVVFLLFAASMMLFYKPKAKKKDADDNNSDKKESAKWKLGLPVGGIAGFVGGLLGVGGGNIIVPSLIALGIPAKNASATTSFIVIFSSFTAFAARASLNSLDGELLLYTVVGSISGALLGSWLMSKKLQNRQVKVIIGILLYFVAAKMLYGLLF